MRLGFTCIGSIACVACVACIGASLASCVGEEPPPLRDPVSIDVILDDDLASIYIRPIGREARCSFNPVLDGTCGIVFTDQIGCFFFDGGGPANRNSLHGCAEELRLGENVVEDSFFGGEEDGVSGVMHGVVTAERTLTVLGCGEDIVVPLDELDAPPPATASTIERVKGGERALALVEGDASHVRLCENAFFSEECCDSAPGLVDIPYSARRGSAYPLTLETIAGPSTTTTPDGVVVRVWRRTVSDLAAVAGVPEQDDFGRWEAGISISGEIGAFDRVVFDPLDVTHFTLAPDYPGGPSVELARDVDTVRMRTFDGKTYVAVVPHEPVDRALPIGTFDELLIDIDHGDVVLTNVDDANDTITAPFRLSGTIHGIPRP